jgi:hypothetical protein
MELLFILGYAEYVVLSVIIIIIIIIIFIYLTAVGLSPGGSGF